MSSAAGAFLAAAGAVLALLRMRLAAKRPASAFGDTEGPAQLCIVSCDSLIAAGSGGSSSYAVAGLDELHLYRACVQGGLKFHVRSWSDASVDWAAYRVVAVRTTWDYSASEATAYAFSCWLARLSSLGVRVLNNERVQAWNLHKSYLSELTALWDGRGGTPAPELEVAAIPSVLLLAGTPLHCIDLSGIMVSRGWRDVMLKPAVGGGSRGCLRLRAADGPKGLAAAQAFLERHVRGDPGSSAGLVEGKCRAALVRGLHHPASGSSSSSSSSSESSGVLPSVDEIVAEAPLALQAGIAAAHSSSASSQAAPIPPQDMMVLPYLSTVESVGEISVLSIDGTVRYAVQKRPLPGEFRCQEEHGAVNTLTALPPALVTLVERVLEGALAVVTASQPELSAPLSPSSAPMALPAPLPPSPLLFSRCDLLPLTPELHAAVYGADGRGAGEGGRVPQLGRTPYLLLELGECVCVCARASSWECTNKQAV